MAGYLIVLLVGLLAGLAGGYLYERRHVRAWFGEVRAASIATTGEHRQRVLDELGRRQHIGGAR